MEKMNQYENQFTSILNDYSNNYILYNQSPEVDEYRSHYLNNKSQLSSISNEVNKYTMDAKTQADQILVDTENTTLLLEKEKNKYNHLLKQLHSIQNTENGSAVLINDSKHAYNTVYYYNWELFAGICLIGNIIYKMA